MDGIKFLKTAIMQLEGEVHDDLAIIEAIVKNPTIAAFDQNAENPGTNIAYAIHQRLHHLGQHKHALMEAYKLMDRLQGEEDGQSGED